MESRRDAISILEAPEELLSSLLADARDTTVERFGDSISLCSIISARSGRCTEDCSFCAQSSTSSVQVRERPFLSTGKILEARTRAGERGAERFSMVTCGRSAGSLELGRACMAISASAERGPEWCASLGILDGPSLRELSSAGLSRYHHNLETARSHFSTVCSTHSWYRRVSTITAAKGEGLEVCSGGIIGVGENTAQRVELAFQLKDLQVDSIALNFLVAIPGTKVDAHRLSPLDMLKTIVMFRMVCPDSELRICAGRELLGTYEDHIFKAGATGMMCGDLLTTTGPGQVHDMELLKAAGRGISR